MGCFVANLLLAAWFCFAHLRSNAQLLPEEEVQTLQTIASKLKNSYWSVNQNSCTVGSGLNVAVTRGFSSNVTCDCSFENKTVCHVKIIELKGLNLTGVMPAELGNLSYLEKIDLSRNYINGSIPTSLSKAPLTFISLLDNRISGSIPKEIGDIANLQDLVLEDNKLGGSLPESLGNLSHLSRLLLSANNFTGTIPPTLGKLKNLTDLRVDGSPLYGKIPDFIGNWTKLTRLDIQGTSMEGPIPRTISSLTNLTQLRISDLNGLSMSFPNIQNLKNLQYLILRNCLINDSIPKYIGDFSDLKTLDLSFNMLKGEIPQTIGSLTKLVYMFLTNNSLTGMVPSAIRESKQYFDLSYNNFTGTATSQSCNQQNVNLISSYSPVEGNSVPWCLKKDLTCSNKPQHHSLFVNCGGSSTRYEGNDYEGDLTPGGPSTFSSFSGKWAYSSTGVYMNNDNVNFIPSNTAFFNNSDREIYGTARVAPLSLNYYGLCMRKGSYTVRLHFAEILYSNDETFSSLGRRLFDVSLQGSLVLKDFNIMEEAKGAGKGIIKEFTNVTVSGTTMEIHLYWSGKGTTAVPDRGVYGPLISAISVTPNFKVDSGLSTGIIVGIVVACCVFLALILVVLRMNGCLGGKDLQDKELQGLELQTGYFTLRQIKAATENFYPGNKIGEGGFGPVYKGVLPDGSIIAVKQLSAKSKQGNREFINEIGMISAVQHPNLVRLYGCCIEGNQLLLIYEFMENNSLARALFGREQEKLYLDWPTRNKICLGIARGLCYLHEESRLKIVHRDIKATNVLLDKNLNAKISDFGLAKLNEEENTHISTRIAGTVGYMAPEYAMRGYLTPKADIYSFGVVALEIVSGKSNTNYRPKEEFVYLLDWAYVLQEQGNLLDLVDPSLGSNYSREEATRMLNLALLCTNPSPTLRPAMSSVVKMLEGQIPVQTPIVKWSAEDQDGRFKAFEKLMHESASSTFSQHSQEQRDVSRDGPGVDSSITTSSMGETQEHISAVDLQGKSRVATSRVR